MHKNEKFLKAMQYMNAAVKDDNSKGHQWKYCNTSSKKVYGFENKRKKNKRLMNCVDGVQDAMRLAGIKTYYWYGGLGEIVWLTSSAQAETEKYFDIIPTGGHTVSWLEKNAKLCDGDILLGYQKFCHTNVYYGGGKSFDSGHAYASPQSGEGAKIKKLIGSLSHKGDKVNWILRLKDRAHYRVQAGAFTNLPEYTKNKQIIEKKGFLVSMVKEDNMYKIQLGYFEGKTNAERFAAKVAKKGISVFVKEIV